MGLTPIPFGVTSYRSRSLPWSAQRCVNWYAATAIPSAKTKSPVALMPRAGLVQGDTDLSGDAVRGYHIMRGILYMVADDRLYTVDAFGVETDLGEIPGSGPVSMAASATQLTIVTTPRAFVYDINTLLLTEITDSAFPGSSSVAFLNQFFLHTVPDSGEFFCSNPGDALEFDELDFATAELNGDDLRCGVADHGEFWAFGSETIEIFYASGGRDFPFARRLETQIERGIVGRNAVIDFDNSLAWVGDDKIVYRANGFTPQRISHDGIDRIIEDTPTPSDIMATSYTQDGHTFLGLRSESGAWSVWYDAATQLWHERETTFDGQLPWEIAHTVNAYGKAWGGSVRSAKHFEMQATLNTDDGSEFRCEATSPPISNMPNRTTMNMLQFDFEAGVGLTTGQGSNPMAMVSVSDDGGKSFGNEMFWPIGMIGEHETICRDWQLGQFRTRVVKVAVSDPVRRVLMGCYGDLTIDEP